MRRGHPWLASLRHDLLKRLLWPARDRRDLGGSPAPGELWPTLVDDEGRPATPSAVWAALAARAPAGAPVAAFGRALEQAEAAARRGDIDGVLGLESAFAELARSVEGDED